MAHLLQLVEGQDLCDALLDSSLAELIEDCQAVYFWRRSLEPPRHVIASAEQFARWLEEVLQVPYAKIGQRRLSHFLTISGLSIGGGPLTDAKIADLKPWLQSHKRRQWTASFLAALSSLLPPLYVGETSNLLQRVQQHLNGTTDFARILTEELKLSWSDVTLHYCRLGEAREDEAEDDIQKNHRTLLELMAARLVVAGCTSRPG
jgi:predicted GIY-YIG superfamily endonuclease